MIKKIIFWQNLPKFYHFLPFSFQKYTQKWFTTLPYLHPIFNNSQTFLVSLTELRLQVTAIHNTPLRFQKNRKGWMGCCGWVFYKNFTWYSIKSKTFSTPSARNTRSRSCNLKVFVHLNLFFFLVLLYAPRNTVLHGPFIP